MHVALRGRKKSPASSPNGAQNGGLERLTEPPNISPADEYAGKREEGLVDIGSALVADTQPAETVKPTECAFDNPAPFA